VTSANWLVDTVTDCLYSVKSKPVESTMLMPVKVLVVRVSGGFLTFVTRNVIDVYSVTVPVPGKVKVAVSVSPFVTVHAMLDRRLTPCRVQPVFAYNFTSVGNLNEMTSPVV